jgi:hypothetical protein
MVANRGYRVRELGFNVHGGLCEALEDAGTHHGDFRAHSARVGSGLVFGDLYGAEWAMIG